MSLYGIRQGPSYSTVSASELVSTAYDQPLSVAETFGQSIEAGILESFGLGTAIRAASLPEGAPTDPGLMLDVEGGVPVQLPDTPQMRRRITAAGNPSSVRPETPDELGDRRAAAGALSEEEYRESRFYRPHIPYDPGMTEDRAAVLAAWDDARQVREHFAAKRPVTAFFGNLAGQAFDPINYIPVAGPVVKAAAVARFGRIGGAATAGALDAVTNTAAFGMATRDLRKSFGDDVSWQAMVSEIAMSGLIGGAFGGIGGALARASDNRVRAEAETRLSTLRNTQDARIALNEAIDGLARDGEVRLTPNALEPITRVAREVEGLSRAYDEVAAYPTGPANDPLVAIRPEDIEGTIVARGAFRDINEVEFSRRGWGLVKIIWRHGDESGKPEALRVTKDDIVALPEIIRQNEPSSISKDGTQREWRVERDGRVVVYADSVLDGERHVVTAYVQDPDHINASKPLSAKRKPAAARSSSDDLNAEGDTNQGLSLRTPDGRPLPAPTNIAPRAVIDNSTARPEPAPQGRAEAEAALGRPDDGKAMAEQYRVDPATGAFDEEAELSQLDAEGRLTAEDRAELEAARLEHEQASAWGEALKTAVNCLI